MNRAKQIPWTPEQLISLAENEHHARTSRNFAVRQRWLELGQSEHAGGGGVVWGRYPDKENAVETAFSVPNLVFRCSCSHRLFPCYHAFGLALLFAEQAEVFSPSEAPDWATVIKELPKRRREGSRTKEAQRLAELRAGLAALELWQRDLVKHGLEAARKQPHRYWNEVADRLLDARAGDLAAEVKSWARLSVSDPRWAETLLARMGRLNLLTEGFKRFESLPGAVQADLKAAVGWPGVATERVRDAWQVVGRHVQQLGGRKVQRVWLWGMNSGRTALLVYVKQGQRRLNTSLLTGLNLEATLAFYPGSVPLRAELVSVPEPGQRAGQVPVHGSIRAAIAELGERLARNPWQTVQPLLLTGLNAHLSESGWFVHDAEGYLLPLPNKFAYGWHLRALGRTGGLGLFGEWDGASFTPLSIHREHEWLDISVLRGGK